ncbi:MAG: hypothetical protein ACI4HQ_14495 [Acetatifactor sp.]
MKKRYIGMILIISLLLSCTACGESKPVEIVTLYSDNYVMEQYAKDFEGFSKVEYERIVIEWQRSGIDTSIGPHEPRYRGIIYLTEEKAKELLDGYAWVEEDNVSFGFEQVDDTSIKDCSWYSSTDFNKDLFKTVGVISLYFNGVNAIVFDIQVQ